MIRRFDAIGYKEMAMSERCLSVKRDVERGFLPFITETLAQVDKLTTSRQQQLSLCELGIGGGGAHELMFQFSEDTHILGVDLFHKDHLEHYKTVPNRGHFLKNHERLSKDQDLSLLCCGERQRRSDQRPNRKESLFHGMNAYKQSTAEHLVSVNGAKLDYVNDDASPDNGAMNGLMDAYKDSISDEGILLSTGPFGNGTQQAYDYWLSGEYVKDLDTLAEQGFVIFDMTEYRQKHASDQPDVTYILSYLAMWAPDFNNYDNLLKKYEHNIINGKENWKHD